MPGLSKDEKRQIKSITYRLVDLGLDSGDANDRKGGGGGGGGINLLHLLRPDPPTPTLSLSLSLSPSLSSRCS